jgi:uncharacterized iron-regulated membrane protein
LINGVLHLLGTLASRSYSPGLVSGLLVWIPLGVFTLQRARHSVKPKIFWRGLAVGVVIHAFVIVLTFFERISAG